MKEGKRRTASFPPSENLSPSRRSSQLDAGHNTAREGRFDPQTRANTGVYLSPPTILFRRIGRYHVRGVGYCASVERHGHHGNTANDRENKLHIVEVTYPMWTGSSVSWFDGSSSFVRFVSRQISSGNDVRLQYPSCTGRKCKMCVRMK